MAFFLKLNKMNLVEIKNKILTSQEVSDEERAFAIANDPELLSAFMIKNNAGSVNLSLRNLGYKVEFKPNESNLVRQIQIILDQKHSQDFEYIVRNFKIDLNKIHPSDRNFILSLRKKF